MRLLHRYVDIQKDFFIDLSKKFKENKIEIIRDICIEAIYIFFDYYLVENLIIDEYYEIFFENNPENKFYQFFFKSNDRSFKVRVYDKS